jgi:putative tryptophan/tyrosine transport system substrate-binding protein
VPGGVIGVLWDKTNATPEFALREVQTAADSIGVQIEVVGAGTDDEINAAFAFFARKGIGAVFVINGFFLFSRRDRLATVAAQYRMPLSGELRGFVEAGALTSYGTNDVSAFRQVGAYVGRILRGEKPADLPVLQPTKFEFLINLKTAREIGLRVPPNVLALADEVIE